MSRPSNLIRYRSKRTEAREMRRRTEPYMYVPCLPRLVSSVFDGTTAPNKLLHNMNIIAGEERLCSTYYLALKLTGWVIPV